MSLILNWNAFYQIKFQTQFRSGWKELLGLIFDIFPLLSEWDLISCCLANLVFSQEFSRLIQMESGKLFSWNNCHEVMSKGSKRWWWVSSSFSKKWVGEVTFKNRCQEPAFLTTLLMVSVLTLKYGFSSRTPLLLFHNVEWMWIEVIGKHSFNQRPILF